MKINVVDSKIIIGRLSFGRLSFGRLSFGGLLFGGLLWCLAAGAAAADYVFSFAPHSERFDVARADNSANLIAMRSLLKNFHGVEGFHFVLIGSAAEGGCNTKLPCNESPLLKRRIEALIGDVTIQQFVDDLQWRACAPTLNSDHDNTVQLMIEAADATELSPQCPYLLQLNDPELPPVLPTSANHTAWIDVNKLPVIHISAASSMRLHISADSESSVISVRQLLNNANRDVSSGRAEAQWTASQLLWSEGIASVEVVRNSIPSEIVAQRRDIGDALRPTLVPIAAETASNTESNNCHIHFALSD